MDHHLNHLRETQACLKVACEEFEDACEDYENHCSGLMHDHQEEKLRMALREEKHDLLKAMAENQIALSNAMCEHMRIYHKA